MFEPIERTDDAPEGLDTDLLDDTIPHHYCKNAYIIPNGAIRCSHTGKFISNGSHGCVHENYDYEQYVKDMEQANDN